MQPSEQRIDLNNQNIYLDCFTTFRNLFILSFSRFKKIYKFYFRAYVDVSKLRTDEKLRAVWKNFLLNVTSVREYRSFILNYSHSNVLSLKRKIDVK